MDERITVVTVPELSAKSGMSQFAIRKLCKDGKLPFLELGNRWLIKVSDFEKLFTAKANNEKG